MITVHHLSNSHSHVVLWLMEELGLDYKIVKHQRNPETALSPDSLRAVHPLAKAPTIEDHGIPMVESTGILMYLLETHGGGRLRPKPDTAEAMQFYQWLTFIEGSAKGPLMSRFILMRLGADAKLGAAMDEYTRKPIAFLDGALAGRETLVDGMFTAADIQLTFFEEIVEAVLGTAAYPSLAAHLGRMRQRDAYKRAEAKGGPVGLASLFRGAVAR